MLSRSSQIRALVSYPAKVVAVVAAQLLQHRPIASCGVRRHQTTVKPEAAFSSSSSLLVSCCLTAKASHVASSQSIDASQEEQQQQLERRIDFFVGVVEICLYRLSCIASEDSNGVSPANPGWVSLAALSLKLPEADDELEFFPGGLKQILTENLADACEVERDPSSGVWRARTRPKKPADNVLAELVAIANSAVRESPTGSVEIEELGGMLPQYIRKYVAKTHRSPVVAINVAIRTFPDVQFTLAAGDDGDGDDGDGIKIVANPEKQAMLRAVERREMPSSANDDHHGVATATTTTTTTTTTTVGSNDPQSTSAAAVVDQDVTTTTAAAAADDQENLRLYADAPESPVPEWLRMPPPLPVSNKAGDEKVALGSSSSSSNSGCKVDDVNDTDDDPDLLLDDAGVRCELDFATAMGKRREPSIDAPPPPPTMRPFSSKLLDSVVETSLVGGSGGRGSGGAGQELAEEERELHDDAALCSQHSQLPSSPDPESFGLGLTSFPPPPPSSARGSSSSMRAAVPPPPSDSCSSACAPTADAAAANAEAAGGGIGGATCFVQGPTRAAVKSQLGALSLEDLIHFIPTFFIPVELAVQELSSQGYTAAHFEQYVANLPAVQVVSFQQQSPQQEQQSADGQQHRRRQGGNNNSSDDVDGELRSTFQNSFIRIHAVGGAIDMTPSIETNKRFARFEPLPSLARPYLAKVLAHPGRWVLLRDVLRIAGSEAEAALPFQGVEAMVYFAQLQHLFMFSLERGGMVARRAPFGVASSHSQQQLPMLFSKQTPCPVFYNELCRMLKRVSPTNTSTIEAEMTSKKPEVLLEMQRCFPSWHAFAAFHSGKFYFDATASSFMFTFEKEKAEMAKLTIEEQLQIAIRKGADPRKLYGLRRKLAILRNPDNPLLEPDRLAIAVRDFIPEQGHINVRSLMFALPWEIRDLLPLKGIKGFLKRYPEHFTVFDYHSPDQRHVMRAGQPLPSGALRRDFTNDEIVALCVQVLQKKPNQRMMLSNLLNRMPEAVKAKFHASGKHFGLAQLLKQHPDSFVFLSTGDTVEVILARAPTLSCAAPMVDEEIDGGGGGDDGF